MTSSAAPRVTPTRPCPADGPRPPLGRSALALAGFLALTFAASLGGALAARTSSRFYLALDRPAWAPPAWLFGPVWSVLYLLMAIAAWLVWRARGWSGARAALGLFVLQLVPNALWTWAFFVRRSGALATLDIAVLLALLVATLLAFRRVRPAAAALLVPYLAWVSFATALTLALWARNATLLG